MRIAHAVARTLGCAYVSLAVVACAPHEQAGPLTAVHLEPTRDRVVLQRADNREVPSGERPYRVGRGLAIAGGATMAIGALFGIIALDTLHSRCSEFICIDPAPFAAAAAGILGGTGVLMLVPGLVLMGNGPTKSEPTTVQRVAGIGLTGIF